MADVNSKETFDSVAVLNNSTGLNQVWNFSALTSSSVTEVSTFTTVASATNGSSFTGATIAEDDGQGGYTFYKATATQYEIVGIDNANGRVQSLTNTVNVLESQLYPTSNSGKYYFYYHSIILY